MRAPRTLALLATLLSVAVAPACAGRRGGGDDEAAAVETPERTVVRVENQGFNDATIYIIRGGSQRIRLGLASGNRSTVFTIPAYLVRFPTPLRFLADPIGGNRGPVSSEITVNPGDEVVLQVPPR